MQPPRMILFFFTTIVALSIGGYFVATKMNKENAGPSKPHIIMILADDMGWNDVSFHGADQIPTHNIDALAYNGVILNRHYVLPICTPSRTSLLTGRYAIREGMQGWPLKVGEPRGIPLDSILMPEYLRKLGYTTHLVGKWHLGYETNDYLPTNRGFDTFMGYYNGVVTYFEHLVIANDTEKSFGHDLHRDDRNGPKVFRKRQYLTDLITDEAENIIKSHGNEKPLFLEIAHLAAHASEADDNLEVRNKDEVDKAFGHVVDRDRKKYAGIIKAMDESVGRVVTALANANMLENSIIVFMSDNGAPTTGLYNNSGSNYPFRGIKATLFEGGVRGAACIFSPRIKSKSRVTDELMHIVDWLPTLYAAAGGNISDIVGHVDGLNLWPAIVEEKKSPRQSVLLNIDDVVVGEAAIVGKYKLVKAINENGNDYYGESGNDGTYPKYNVKDALQSPAGLAINQLPGFNKLSTKRAESLRSVSTVRCLQARTQLNCSRLCLFDVWNDPCETQDLSGKNPEIVERLKSLIDDYRKVAAPQANADVDPCSNPKFFNGNCMPWRTNLSKPFVVGGTSIRCQHPKY